MKRTLNNKGHQMYRHFYVLLLAVIVLISCKEQGKPNLEKSVVVESEIVSNDQLMTFNFSMFEEFYQSPDSDSLQIAEYVRRIFQDNNGQFWFGTNNYGVGRFNGRALTYFSTEEGLSGAQVTGIIEDKKGNLWFTTNGGVSMYDGISFTNYTKEQGLSHNRAWSILEDSKGTIWVGTLNGLCRFNGTSFEAFPIPLADVKDAESRFSTKLVRSIMEDSKGNLWFGIDGGGVCIYDGKNFSHLTEEDGLTNNNVVRIIEDSQGDFWFGTMFGGLSHYDGKTFTNYTYQNKIGNNEVWHVYEDSNNNIWFSSEGFGVYRYDGKEFTNFGEKEGLGVKAVQSIFEDKDGRIWVGGGGGLYRFYDEYFTNINRGDLLGRTGC